MIGRTRRASFWAVRTVAYIQSIGAQTHQNARFMSSPSTDGMFPYDFRRCAPISWARRRPRPTCPHEGCVTHEPCRNSCIS